jgi:hypothetical protein
VTVASTASGENGSISTIRRIQFKKNGGAQAAHKHGIFIGSRCNLEEVFVNGFTNTGIYLGSYLDEVNDPSFVDHLPFFNHFLRCRAWNCGEDGMQIRLGANTQIVENCQFNRNGRYGMYHHDGNDGTGGQGGSAGAPPTYGSMMLGGEASYNWGEGWRWESGTQLNCMGMYAEGNGRDTPDGTGHVNTPYDFYIGDTVDKSNFMLGSVKDTASVRVRVPSPPQYTTHIMQGGQSLSPWWAAVADASNTTTSVQTQLNALLAQFRSKGYMP